MHKNPDIETGHMLRYPDFYALISGFYAWIYGQKSGYQSIKNLDIEVIARISGNRETTVLHSFGCVPSGASVIKLITAVMEGHMTVK